MEKKFKEHSLTYLELSNLVKDISNNISKHRIGDEMHDIANSAACLANHFVSDKINLKFEEEFTELRKTRKELETDIRQELITQLRLGDYV